MKQHENILLNTNPDRERWASFVLEHPFGTAFQTPSMFEVYKTTPFCEAGVVALETKQQEILGLIVYSLIAEPGIKSAISRRSIITGGPLVKNNDLDIAKQLLEAYKSIIRKANAIYSEVRNLFDIEVLKPVFTECGFAYQAHLTIHMDLSKSLEELENAMHKKRAANIRRAIKKEVRTRDISSPEEIQCAYKIIHDTYIRIGLPSPHPELFQNAAKAFGKNIKFHAAFIGDKMIGCRVYLLFKDMMYDWYAAGDMEHTGLHPNDLLPWSAMQWGKANNMRIYDFAGAGKPGQEYGVRDYKLKFGGTLLEFGRYQYIHKPLLYQFGVIGIKLYKYIKR